MKAEMVKNSISYDSKQIERIAAPIVLDMQMIKPTLVKLHEYVPLKVSIILTIVVFIGNLCLHLLAMYLYHRFVIFKKLTPSLLKDGKQKFSLKPIITTMAGIDIIRCHFQKTRTDWTRSLRFLPQKT